MYAISIRRYTGLVGLALLALLVASGPLCLLTPPIAVATPMGNHGDCAPSPGDTHVCPHLNRMQVPTGITNGPDLVAAPTPALPVPDLTCALLDAAADETARGAPTGSMVPLRL